MPKEKAELIICEKPAQAEKIAAALAKKPKKVTQNRISYYEVEYEGKKILVGCAVGHLYTLAQKEKKGWTYPVFDIEWKPSSDISKKSGFSNKYLTPSLVNW